MWRTHLRAGPGRPADPPGSAGWCPWTGTKPPPPRWDSGRRDGSCTRWWSECWCWRGAERRCPSPPPAAGTGCDPCGWRCSCVRWCRPYCLQSEGVERRERKKESLKPPPRRALWKWVGGSKPNNKWAVTRNVIQNAISAHCKARKTLSDHIFVVHRSKFRKKKLWLRSWNSTMALWQKPFFPPFGSQIYLVAYRESVPSWFINILVIHAPVAANHTLPNTSPSNLLSRCKVALLHWLEIVFPFSFHFIFFLWPFSWETWKKSWSPCCCTFNSLTFKSVCHKN